MNCSKLEQIKLPRNLEIIDDSAFYNCSALTTIDFTDATQLKFIKKSTFMNCSNLNQIKLPPNLEIISERAFSGCDSLKQVDIPLSLRYIEGDHFLIVFLLKYVYYH